MSDETTSIGQLRQMVRQFVADRDWQQFHAPKNISMALAIEAAELMEHFQWMSVDESRDVARDEPKFQQVQDELADIVCYAMAFANELDIDIADAMRRKMAKNVQKYPADKYQGKYELPKPDCPD